MMRTVISGGTVVTPDGASPLDLLVQDEQIAALAAPFSGLTQTWQESADLVVDATGKYVLPGGIDAHTHMEMPFGGTMSADTFETGTRAAAWGGTTMIIDFAIQTKGGSLLAGMDTWQAKAAGVSAVDYSFHAIISDVTDTSLKEMDELVAQGV
ncbi:MAG: amidohydrolase family protein, partial [Acidimicrobiales bacterium]